jgi:hypothetical protein
MPVKDAIEAHVHAAERLHVDDTTVPVLAKGKCITGRLRTHVQDDRPFAAEAAPAAVYYYSPSRNGEYPQEQLKAYTGIIAKRMRSPVSTPSMSRTGSRSR